MKKKRVLINVETSRAYGREIIRGIVRYLAENDRWTVYLEDRGLQENHDWVKKWQGDGIISRTSSDEMGRLIARKGIPTVELLGDGISIVSEVPADERKTAKMAADHLLDCHLTEFAFFTFGNAWWSNLRCQYFQETLAEKGFSVHVFPGTQVGPPCIFPEWDAMYDKMLPAWLTKLPKPIGLWAVNDFAATRIIEACDKTGIPIPEEIALLGTTNDTLLCNLQAPPLSSVDMNSVQVGYTAAKLLDQKMAKKQIGQNMPILISPNGVVPRQSTDITAVSDPDIAEALQFIRNNGNLGITVRNVAEHIGLSLSTLERRFREILKRTPEKEIMRIRIRRAKQLLLESELTVKQVSEKTGFATPEYFIRVFRQEVGFTPKHFRSKLSAN